MSWNIFVCYQTNNQTKIYVSSPLCICGLVLVCLTVTFSIMGSEGVHIGWPVWPNGAHILYIETGLHCGIQGKGLNIILGVVLHSLLNLKLFIFTEMAICHQETSPLHCLTACELCEIFIHENFSLNTTKYIYFIKEWDWRNKWSGLRIFYLLRVQTPKRSEPDGQTLLQKYEPSLEYSGCCGPC